MNEGEDLLEHEEVAERDTHEEKHAARDDERSRKALLVLVEAGRNERPRLVEHVGQRHQECGQGRDLDGHHERRDHARRDHLRPFGKRAHQGRGEQVVDIAGARPEE